MLGPGLNMKRNQLCGRSFEYFSEDPYLAGKLAAGYIRGIQSKGVYVYLKHVALNDSESSRRGVNTWLNEQAAREIYLEVANKAITDGGAWSVMTGFNRWGAYWCGAYDNLLTGFLRSIPRDYEEAAMIDGCGPFRILTSIIIPMCKPGIVTVCMISAMAAWNEYPVALVMVTDPTKATLPVGLANLYEIQRYATDWGALFAALVLALIPTVILFIVGQKQLVQGLSVGGVKG